MTSTNASGAVFFMIVSFPAEAADTNCRSIDLLIFALRDYSQMSGLFQIAMVSCYELGASELA